jgi:murein DD-endopeptidase MepM/ murein hydrolase activator NlpD
MKKDIFFSILLAIILIYQIDLITNQRNNHPKGNSSVSINKQKTLFDIDVSKSNVLVGEVQAGMYLGNIFSKYNIPQQKATEIIQKTKGVFDVKKVKRGQKYFVIKNENTSDVDYIVYEQNNVDYVIFDFRDNLEVIAHKKEVKTEIKSAGGEIKSALWFAMEDAGINPLLSNDLSEIYAWSIDFFGLQKGDKFKLIYEERFVDGHSIGFGKIIAAYFEHLGKEIYAIPFKQDSAASFYDVTGQNLKKAFLKAPLKYSRISSGFSMNRMHPILKRVMAHQGVDYCAPSGTPVFALGDGTVIQTSFDNKSGNLIKIKHNGVYITMYMHLRAFGPGIHQGVRVTQGQLIGYVGSTGRSTGPHLDFRVKKNGEFINPLKIDAPAVEPVKKENMAEFNKIAIKYKSQLSKTKIITN